jgi:hypothetical protein
MLFAVGGTGQHVALAAARLSYLGALPPLDVVVIDADDGSDLTKALKTFGDTARPGDGHPLRTIDMFSPLPESSAESSAHMAERFGELFPLESDAAQQELFEAFFDAPSAEVKIKHGMYGNPAVGATVFAHASAAELVNRLTLAQAADKVFVTGSFVGGTGAGVIHQLLHKLSTMGCQEKSYLVALLPWQAPDRSVSTDVPLSETAMGRNMAFGCHYLHRTSRHYVQQACVLGIPEDSASSVVPARIEVGVNKEYPHLLHALACHFIYDAYGANVLKDARNEVYTYLHDPTRSTWLWDQPWHEGHSLKWYLMRARALRSVLSYLCSTRVQEQFAGSFGLFGAKKDTYSAALHATIKKNCKRSQKPKARSEEVWKHLHNEHAKVNFTLQWAKQIFGTLPVTPALEKLDGDAAKDVTRAAATEPMTPLGGDRVHEPGAMAAWYVDKLNADLGKRIELGG